MRMTHVSSRPRFALEPSLLGALLLALTGCGGAPHAATHSSHCSYDYAYRAGMNTAHRGDRLGGFAQRCEPAERAQVERGYREGYFAGLGCALSTAGNGSGGALADTGSTKSGGAEAAREPAESSATASPRCTYEFGLRAGINDGIGGRRMSGFASRCDEATRAETERGYREGYDAATGCVAERARREAEERARLEAARAAEREAYLASHPAPPPAVVQAAQAAPEPEPAAPPRYSCCVNHQYFACPSASAVDQCVGPFTRCTAASMRSGNMMGAANCLFTNPPDPSACERNENFDGNCN